MQGPCGVRRRWLRANSERLQVATSRRNEVLVADCGNHRVQVFTLDGNLKRIMWEGLRYPICVATRKSGEVLVTERGGSSVKILSSDGRVSCADAGGDTHQNFSSLLRFPSPQVDKLATSERHEQRKRRKPMTRQPGFTSVPWARG